jgi:hypothetical protein
MGRLRDFGAGVAEQIKDSCHAMRRTVSQYRQRLTQSQFAKVRNSRRCRPIQAIQKCSDIEQLGTMFKKILPDNLFPTERTGAFNIFHETHPVQD